MAQDWPVGPVAWRFLLLVSGVAGFCFADLTISGLVRGWEGSVALALLFAVAFIVSSRRLRRPVLHGFGAGFLTGLFAIELQALFLPLYFSNNPGYSEIDIPFGLSARVATALLAPLPASLAGALTAVTVWLLNGLWRDRGKAVA